MSNTRNAVAVITEPSVAEEFQEFVKLDTQFKVFGVKANAAYILSGVELLRLHAKYGIKRGGDQSRTREALLWRDLVKQYGGISEDTAARRMKVAEAAADRLLILREVLEGEADPRLLPAAKKIALEEALHTLTDGKSLRQLMWDFGLQPAKLRGGLRLNAQHVEEFLKAKYPKFAGTPYEQLPTHVKAAVRKYCLNKGRSSNASDQIAGANSEIETRIALMMSWAQETDHTVDSCDKPHLKSYEEARRALGRKIESALERRK